MTKQILAQRQTKGQECPVCLVNRHCLVEMLAEPQGSPNHDMAHFLLNNCRACLEAVSCPIHPLPDLARQRRLLTQMETL